MHSFIKYLCLSVASLIIVGCGSDSNKFRIEGEFTGMKNAELFIYNPYDPTGTIDTIKVSEGEFRYEGEVDAPAPYLLLFPNAMEHIIFVGPGSKVQYSAASNDLKNYSVKGTAENDLMTQFRNETSQLDNKKTKDTAARFINEHLDDIVAKYLFDRYFIQNATATKAEMMPLLKSLEQTNPDDQLFISIKAKLDVYNKISVGDKVKDITLTDRNGKTFNLWKGRGIIDDVQSRKQTLIFVWATWMYNSYDFLWRIRQLCYNNNSSEIHFVGISLDNNDERWRDITRSDSLIIDHAREPLGWNSKVIQKLGATDVPLFIFTDSDHKVVAIKDNIEEVREYMKK